MNALWHDIAFYVVNLLAIAAIFALNSCDQVRGKRYLMAFLIFSVLASVFGQGSFMLMRSGTIERETYNSFLTDVGPVIAVARMAGWALLFLFILDLRQGQGTSTAPAGEKVRETLDNQMSALFVIALLYVIGTTGMFIWLASQAGGMLRTGYLLPRLGALAVAILLYVMAMRHAQAKTYGRATGYMIAAGILNLPIGIVALVMGIVARRTWKHVEKQRLSPASEAEPAPAVSAGDVPG